MAEPQRELILQAIEARLQTCRVAAGYRTDVHTVERRVKTPAETVSKRPWLGIATEGEDRVTNTYARTQRKVMNIVVFGYLDAGKQQMDIKDKKTNRLVDDLRKLLMADQRMGGTCTMVTIVGEETSEGNAELDATVKIRAEVVYHQAFDQLT